MRYETNPRGEIIASSLRMTPAEVAKRGWLTRDLNAIPLWAHDEVKRHRAAQDEAWHRADMESRYGKGYQHRQQQDPLHAPDGKCQLLQRMDQQRASS